MFLKKLIPALAPLALVASPALAKNPAARPDINPALWVVKDADTTIYLFGTIHVLDGKSAWFNDEVKASFDKASDLMLEVVLPEDKTALAPLVLKYGIDSSGKKLSDKLSPEGKVLLEKAAKEAGIPMVAMDRFKPFFASVTLSTMATQKMGMKAEDGAELTLTEAAKAGNKTLGGLETVEFQMSRFDALPEAEQIKLLEASLKEPEATKTVVSSMIDAWGKGDTERLAKILSSMEEESSALNQMLLIDRNKNWSDWIQKRMAQPGTVFIAVGAGHLAGKDSVQDFLKARGLSVSRVPHINSK